MSVPLAIVLSVGTVWPLPATDCHRMTASWYGEQFRGQVMASGQPFDPDAHVAAHLTWDFGTAVVVHGPEGSTTVEIVDRGPFIEGRDLDLSEAAFASVADLDDGVVDVTVCAT